MFDKKFLNVQTEYGPGNLSVELSIGSWVVRTGHERDDDAGTLLRCEDRDIPEIVKKRRTLQKK